MREEGKREYGDEHGGVVGAEVGEVLAATNRGVGKGRRPGDGGEVEEFEPRASAGDGASQNVGNGCDIRADSCGERRVGHCWDFGKCLGVFRGRRI